MATILLSSIGSIFGPIGQIVGALAGNAIDNAIIGSREIEGPRLKELAVSGSSYGTPIAAQYGTIRVPGTIIWSTDLQEHREKQSNGKGQPKSVNYSYSISFAVALSSRPIDGVGRIWADGNLLRGSAGDLKSGGTLRIHRGLADQSRDPLLEAALGDQCPAFRGCAYAVFEDLDLTDFGNRIPALSFEVIAGEAETMVEALVAGHEVSANATTRFDGLSGYSHEGGSLRDVVQLVDRLNPLAPRIEGAGITLTGAALPTDAVRSLPPCAAWDEGDFGKQGGSAKARSDTRSRAFAALRYYDPDREYQAGLQHAENSEARTLTFQFPGVLEANVALDLARRANVRAAAQQDSLSWRCVELDPAIAPGSLVTAPGHAGTWQVTGWEWRAGGIELELLRHRRTSRSVASADSGSAWHPRDRLSAPTVLRAIEPPWDGNGSAEERHAYLSACAQGGRWSGCALYSVRDGAFSPLGQFASERAVMGSLIETLAPSDAMRFEHDAAIVVQLLDREAEFVPTDLAGIAQGENRLLVGSEVLQFAAAEPLGEGTWRLSGLLRGRGATEAAAATGHVAGTCATLLDDRLVTLPQQALASSTGEFAAIGLGDEQAVTARIDYPGSSRRPLAPVHGKAQLAPDGSLSLSWIRRARGQWLWLDEVEPPLVEESEVYEVVYSGSSSSTIWTVGTAGLTLSSSQTASVISEHGPGAFAVRQLGRYGKSAACLLGTFG